jgi:hypothetical protein
MEKLPGRRRGRIDVTAGEEVTLLLDGGGPFLIKRIALRASTFDAGGGLSPRAGEIRMGPRGDVIAQARLLVPGVDMP